MLKMRMDILEQGGVISKRIADYMRGIIDIMGKKFPDIVSEKAVMFTTHMAMALERISNGQIVEPMEDYMWEEVKASPNFTKAEEFYCFIKHNIPVSIPESELQFLLLHICNIFQ